MTTFLYQIELKLQNQHSKVLLLILYCIVADAGEQNGCLTRDEHIQTELNLSEAATMNDVNENGEIEGANVSKGVSCSWYLFFACFSLS